MENAPGWIAIAIGIFIIWKVWGRKKNKVAPQGVYVVQVPGAPVRKRSSLGTVLFLLAVLVAILWGSDWFLKNVPPLPPYGR